MVKLIKHIWNQLVNDEDAARHWLTAAKTSAVAFTAQIAIAVGGDFARLSTWTHWQWLGVIAGTIVAAGAKVAAPVLK